MNARSYTATSPSRMNAQGLSPLSAVTNANRLIPLPSSGGPRLAALLAVTVPQEGIFDDSHDHQGLGKHLIREHGILASDAASKDREETPAAPSSPLGAPDVGAAA